MEVWQSPVYCTCLENRRTEMFREFESHRFRQLNIVIKEKKELFIVYWKDTVGRNCEKEFDGLTSALTWSKGLNHFVTIKGNGNEIVGKFGADSVENGILPNGDIYTWKKRRR